MGLNVFRPPAPAARPGERRGGFEAGDARPDPGRTPAMSPADGPAHDYYAFDNAGVALPAGPWLPGPGYELRVVRPRLLHPRPWGLPLWPFFAYWVLHRLHLFGSRDYVVYVVTCDGALVHRTALTPKYFRLPFMGRFDLMIGSTWTDPRHRGRSIGQGVLAEILRAYPGRRCWYLTRIGNLASTSVARSAGLRPIGRVTRTSPLGLRIFGVFSGEGNEGCP